MLTTIFAAIISKFIGVGVDASLSSSTSPVPGKTIEQYRLELKPPSPSDSTQTEIIRYEYTMELINKTRAAISSGDLSSAKVYINEAHRIAGYHGTVRELYEEVNSK